MRIEGWERRLAELLAADRPFSWGQNDCLIRCGIWVEEATGEDHYSAWIGQYSTESDARTLMRARGFNDYADIPDSILSVTPVMLAQRGDLVLHPSGSLGICNGLKSHFIGEKGPFTENTLSCLRAWKVQ